MRRLSFLVTLIVAALLYGAAFSAPIVIVRPGNEKNIIITEENTVNATRPAPINGTLEVHSFVANSSPGQLPLALVNNLQGGQVNAYVTGLDS